jgi:hypothetical protein
MPVMVSEYDILNRFRGDLSQRRPAVLMVRDLDKCASSFKRGDDDADPIVARLGNRDRRASQGFAIFRGPERPQLPLSSLSIGSIG